MYLPVCGVSLQYKNQWSIKWGSQRTLEQNLLIFSQNHNTKPKVKVAEVYVPLSTICSQ